ncbi:unnamed protein product [Brassica rapa]|uniref:Uncharacterized protein n=1 Tax=Brassica campestris TaxID=3711 RepID=A0A8D9DMQ9_BRACM|nr:unnamed protein product [Brassica rapa]
MLSPRTNVLIYVLCVLTDTHGRPVCAGGHPQTSCTFCVCWRTPTDVLCVLNRQPTWAKITQTVHGKGQHADSKDQRADICTDGQPRTSYSPRGQKSPEQSMGRVSVLSPRTNVLICVLTDTHRCPVCADGHTRTHTESHGHPVCADGQPRTQPTWAKITRTVHGKGQRAERHVCADGHARTHTDTHGHTRTATDVLCVLTDTHGRPVCADGHPQTSCVQPTWAKITQTVHGKGQRAESKDQRADMASVQVLVCTDGQPRTSCVCRRTHTDSHGRPVYADGHTRTSCVC